LGVIHVADPNNEIELQRSMNIVHFKALEFGCGLPHAERPFQIPTALVLAEGKPISQPELSVRVSTRRQLRQCSGRDHNVGAVRSSLPSMPHAADDVRSAMEQRILAWTALAVLLITSVWLKAKPLLDDVLDWLIKKKRIWRQQNRI
jgi:hypothetical protein